MLNTEKACGPKGRKSFFVSRLPRERDTGEKRGCLCVASGLLSKLLFDLTNCP